MDLCVLSGEESCLQHTFAYRQPVANVFQIHWRNSRLVELNGTKYRKWNFNTNGCAAHPSGANFNKYIFSSLHGSENVDVNVQLK